VRGVAALLGFALLSALSTGVALAGPPYQTDDPEPTPYRHYEIYLNTQNAVGGGVAAGDYPQLEVNYGLMPNVQFSANISLAGSQPSGERLALGFGDLGFGLKVRFVAQSRFRPDVAFYPSVQLPTGNAARGLGAGLPKVFLPLWAQKDVGHWSFFGGGGWWHNPGPGNRDYPFTGFAAVNALSERLSIGTELYHSGAQTVLGKPSTSFGVGMEQQLGEHHAFLFSVGRSLDRQTTFSSYAAYAFLLGPKASQPEK
jgi:hypothetical protein